MSVLVLSQITCLCEHLTCFGCCSKAVKAQMNRSGIKLTFFTDNYLW